jgi:hypothetical protein
MMLTDKLELAGRYDRLLALEDTDPALDRLAEEQGHEVGGGVNLYLNGHYLKFQADYAARFGREPACGADAGNCGAGTTHLARLQLDASF